MIAMKRVWIAIVVTTALAATLTSTLNADTLAPAFAGSYTLTNLGSPGGVPGPLGGLAFLDSDTLLVGGYANTSSGGIYQIDVTRNGSGHIDGFSGAASLFSTAPNIDGGLAFGPGGVLFFTGYPTDTMGEIKPGSGSPDKIVGVGAAGSVGSLQFAPNGDLKILSYSGGGFYTGTLTADGSGTYDLTGLVLNATPGRGPEGMIYVPAGSPVFAGPSMLLAEYSTGTVGAYLVDGSYNPIVGSRLDFITGLSGAEGAALDPVTNDFLFSTFGGGNHIDVVSGFAPPPPPTVPEPGSLLLLGAGLTSIAGLLRRKQRQ